MPKIMTWEDENGSHLLPYVEPREIFDRSLTLINAWELVWNNVRHVILHVTTKPDGATMYVGLAGAKIERVHEVLRWNGKGKVDFVIRKSLYYLKREDEEQQEKNEQDGQK